MPRNPLGLVTRPIQQFLRFESAGGIVLMVATVLAMLLANSGAGVHWEALLQHPLQVGVGQFALHKAILLWINDGLMALFFLVVGMELKRELVAGHLSSLDRALLPAIAALGGMAAPALIYMLFNHGNPVAVRGWAIPTATDIAFALGVLSLLGSRVPAALKAFLLSVAIFDDLGAIAIIAVFYTAQLSMLALGIAALLLATLVAMNLRGVVRLAPYLIVGVALWVALLKSGVHATLAGVMLAMCMPLRVAARDAQGITRGSPLLRVEKALHPWVVFGILPLFALANAGVSVAGVTWTELAHPVPLGIACGLFLGKPAGIMLACWLAVKSRVAAMPERVGWLQLFGVTVICGIGFTMSLFVASLAFAPGQAVHAGLERMGILMGTLVSGIAGLMILAAVLPPRAVRGG